MPPGGVKTSRAESAAALKAEPDAPFPIPLTTPPMEALSAQTLPKADGVWQYEPKWDGFRCLAFKQGGKVELRAKSGKSLLRYFPEVVAFLADLPSPCFVVDGELVIEVDGRLSFEALQMRLHPAESRIRKLAAATPARLTLFDMLVAPDGAILLNEPLSRRRAVLETFIASVGVSKTLTLSPRTLDDAVAEGWLKAAGRGETDGVVAKRLDGFYEAGQRAMIKVKHLRTADCVVGGFRYESGGQEVGSLLLGLYDAEGKLNHIGFTSTISDVERPALTRQLEALRQTPGFTGQAPGGPSRWSTERSGEWTPVRPVMVAEVRFDHVTDGRFRHGTKLIRWRPDKAPRQCTLEQIAPAQGAA
ncbi:ATP-dependent DNA ligase [Methylocella tundrae]|uniref:DNA ligase (ATP) n=1 Tax=Methylocella tundrae TaxID=227605 RepID=A0A4U8Z3K3_METTU|nr:ATP-dependent DNA ligase [Methylocella tundrae]WPP06464.1 ATP-dependent DNA ligase [Methylocella tundrae]VFU10000.1 DNA ligase C2 [Methylocella tundrae]